MKAKELQIGDYVNYRGQIIKVTSLYDKGGSNEVGWSDKESVWVNGRCIEPIPLLQRFLKRMGLENAKVMNFYSLKKKKEGHYTKYCGLLKSYI